MELRSSARVLCPLNPWAISPAPCYCYCMFVCGHPCSGTREEVRGQFRGVCSSTRCRAQDYELSFLGEHRSSLGCQSPDLLNHFPSPMVTSLHGDNGGGRAGRRTVCQAGVGSYFPFTPATETEPSSRQDWKIHKASTKHDCLLKAFPWNTPELHIFPLSHLAMLASNSDPAHAKEMLHHCAKSPGSRQTFANYTLQKPLLRE